MLRVVDEYARWSVAQQGCGAGASIYEAFDKKLPRHPLVLEGLRETKAGKKLPPLVDSWRRPAPPRRCYGIGAALTRRGGEDLGAGLSAARALSAAQPSAGAAVARRSLRVREEAADGDQDLRAHAGELAAEAQRADPARDQSRRRRPQRGRRSRSSRTSPAEDAKDIEAIMALGNIERGRKRFADCATTYTQAIEALPPRGDKNSLGHLLLSRHLRGALQAVEQGAKPTCARRSRCSPSSRMC